MKRVIRRSSSKKNSRTCTLLLLQQRRHGRKGERHLDVFCLSEVGGEGFVFSVPLLSVTPGSRVPGSIYRVAELGRVGIPPHHMPRVFTKSCVAPSASAWLPTLI